MVLLEGLCFRLFASSSKVPGSRVQCQGIRVWGSGFLCLGFWVQGSASKVAGLQFRVWSLGYRVYSGVFQFQVCMVQGLSLKV
jgi:hypothetical protein